ncbi:TonB-dependent siderophore receptor [Dyella subtropica]|uniref:TonB-dependent siderophore receptor n=1 Tax=Dyella subtropica TaxID=2992127 RepID=UPI00224EE64F|nr:TonB-dependent receptor [Dyella subtropica]
MDFAIPAQPLSTALFAFGKRANVQVLTAGHVVAGLRSTGVQGSFTADAALSLLLEGTGLGFEYIDEGTVVVRPLPAAVAAAPAKTASPVASVTEAKQLAPVHALGLFESGYRGDATSSTTRIDSDLGDVPESIGVVTRDLMDSEQARTVAEAVKGIAGVQYINGSIGLPQFQIRGFHTGNGMTDGMPNSIAGVGDLPPLIGVERIEVLKGPQAILGDVSSNNNFGGLINLVMKKPQREPIHMLTYAVGDHGDAQLGADFAGALSANHGLMYRLVVSGERTDRTAQGYVGQRNNYVAPSLGWEGQGTQLIVGMARTVNRVPVPDHTMLLGDSLSSASPDGILLGNAQEHSKFRTSRYYYLFEHAFGDTWSFRSRGQYVHEIANEQSWYLDSPSPSGDVYATADLYRYSDAFYTLQNDVVATFDQGRVRHTVVVGFDYSRARIGRIDDAQASIGDGTYNFFSGGRLPPVSTLVVPSSSSSTSGEPWVTDSGLFLQDQVKLGERWDVLLALRRAAYLLSTNHLDGSPWVRHQVHWVPNAGVVYKASPGISVYASTTSGFQPDTVLGQSGRPLLPALSRQVEAGVKFDLFQNRARLTMSWYRIMLDHSTDAYSPKPPYFGIPGPGQTNKGVEVEFNGQLVAGWDVSASYTYARIHNHDGSLATGAPRQRFHLWTSYAFQSAALHGWGVAGGVHARSRAVGLFTDGTTTFNNPGQASVDANVFYHAKNWSVTLGAKNLWGRRLYGEDFDETFVPLYRRRTVLLTGTYAF